MAFHQSTPTARLLHACGRAGDPGRACYLDRERRAESEGHGVVQQAPLRAPRHRASRRAGARARAAPRSQRPRRTPDRLAILAALSALVVARTVERPRDTLAGAAD